MPNDIPQRQNAAPAQTLAAAYHRAYELGAWYATAQSALIIGTAVVVPAVGTVEPAFLPWGALVGALVVVIDVLFLEPAVKRHQESGARVQEMFDTAVLDVPWNQVKVGDRATSEAIHELAITYRRNHATDTAKIARLVDWYPPAIAAIPDEYARLICQRSNLIWDADLRQRFGTFYVALIVLMAATGFAYALAMDWSLTRFLLSVAAPLLPACVKVWRSYTKQVEAANSSVRTRQALESVWAQAMQTTVSPEIMLVYARHLQDELFDRRRTISRIPSWFYARWRAELQSQMEAAAAQMVADVKQKFGIS